MWPQSQLRSSGESIGPHLESSCKAAASGSAEAMRISASTTISLRAFDAAEAAPVRNFTAPALTWSKVGSASGATRLTAARAAPGRLASMARRVRFQASLGESMRAEIRRSAAVRQPSSRSRWPNQLRRTVSACAFVAWPVRSTSTTMA